MTYTHTFAELEVSAATYDEIAAQLREADYQHAFIEHVDGRDAAPVIDMHGIGLVRKPEDEVLAAIKKAGDMVFYLCQPRGSEGARSWSMSIPARPDYDPDIVIGTALFEARREIVRLREGLSDKSRMQGALADSTTMVVR